MPEQDPFAALREELRRLVPYVKASAAAREIGVSVSHLHGILKGTSDASAEVRAKIARFVARHGGTVIAPSELGVDFPAHPPDTAPQPVVGPSESRGLEVLVPTPYHAALCDLITTLPVPAVLKLIPQVVQLAEQEYQKLHQPPAPADDTK